MLVLGHRGASAAFPENTLAAFQGAIDQGADGIELDVRRTSDGAMAIHHDAELPDGRALVDTALADLPPAIPVLADVLDVCAPLAVVNIEIKNWVGEPDFDAEERLAGEVVGLLESRAQLGDGRHLVSSFSLATIDRVHELAPGLATAWLLGFVDDLFPLLDKAAAHGHVAVHPHHSLVTTELVQAAHALGLAVNTWTCDDPTRIKELAAQGVDAVVTNAPDVALAALGR